MIRKFKGMRARPALRAGIRLRRAALPLATRGRAHQRRIAELPVLNKNVFANASAFAE